MSDGRTAGPEVPAGPDARLRLSDFTRLPLIVIAVMATVGAVLYPSLPGTLPIHWGVSGRPDGFAPKGFWSVFLLPAIALGTYALLVAVPLLDPKRANLKLSIRAYNIVLDMVVGLLAVIFAASMVAAYDIGFPVTKVMLPAMGVMFMVLGRLMADVKQNWTFGVRVSWTLSDEVVWDRTNRLGGRLFTGVGVVTFACTFLPAPYDILVMLAATLLVLPVVLVYSYALYRRRHPDA